MKKNPEIFLRHIKQSIDEIGNHVKGVSRDDFMNDIKTQDAVIRRIEIIGEAIKNLSADFKNKHGQIEWREIADMRNKLIHEYFGVDEDLVWKVIKNDLPKLKKRIQGLLKEFKQ